MTSLASLLATDLLLTRVRRAVSTINIFALFGILKLKVLNQKMYLKYVAHAGLESWSRFMRGADANLVRQFKRPISRPTSLRRFNGSLSATFKIVLSVGGGFSSSTINLVTYY